MTNFEILGLAGGAAGLLVMIYLAVSKGERGSPLVAAMLFGGFTAFTAVAIWLEGPMGFIPNHTSNLLGVQVWYDLVMSVGIALFFILPRSRAVGMQSLPWIIFVGCTASIGLFAMVARLLWLEGQAEA
ncbi:hypothetical protein [Altererythrobacter sp. ZODW24]|uniref:hypothetical protein n=1 Tax=Altererythrobacter sp. ZODW24 TaxID=2185142 RepID=UPI000DF79EB4|nr:hypothetical protein [Altererythrobacter sp. ZODW24]